MKKVFDNEYSAKSFAERVGGEYKQSYLPNYMHVDTIWVVEWNAIETTLTEEESRVGIVQLYDNIAKKIHGKAGEHYDCSKVLVGQSVFEACREYYYEQGCDDVGFAMNWCCYGPKAELDGYDVTVEEGWCEL